MNKVIGYIAEHHPCTGNDLYADDAFLFHREYLLPTCESVVVKIMSIISAVHVHIL